jgi:hypothetical protein
MTNDVQDAIERARVHLRLAIRESLEASRALVDAALLATGTDETSRAGLAGEVRSALDSWIATLDQDRAFRMPAAFADTLEQALQAEIDRWEQRSAQDASARPVLRAFLGLRELLWELGLRRGETQHPPSSGSDRAQSSPHRDEAMDMQDETASPDRTAGPERKSRPRVQRFDLGER